MISEIFSLQNPWRNQSEFQFDLKQREILDPLIENIHNELIIGLLGSRQVGKSSLLYLLIDHLLKGNIASTDIFYFNLDDLKLHDLFSSVSDFIRFLGNGSKRKYVFIDEIQRLNSPGLFLKEVFDLNQNIKIFYSGSSQLEIKAKTKEHLVGRARVFQINRLSLDEYVNFAHPIIKKDALYQIMQYGSYPAVAKQSSQKEKQLRIKDIYQSYVQKDLTDFLKLSNIETFNKLLVKLAQQTGELLNINALANTLKVSRVEIERYIDILEYTFICKRIYPFHKNYGKEITKTSKIYFLDLGLRNFILNNFQSLDLRADIGQLFENFYYTQLVCRDFYSMEKVNFWRTTNQTEIDFILQDEKGIHAFEVKWSSNKQPKSFYTIKAYYPGIDTQLININHFLTNY